ncbi:hypothetical protein [Streptomyces sp. DW26H14]|uniref:hypothetical protein n=1 Tax=Streptomyces sp. DW26H14 TaxID=3435395 RepID=UPI00403DB43B
MRKSGAAYARPASRGAEIPPVAPYAHGAGPVLGSIQGLAGNRAAAGVVQRLATAGDARALGSMRTHPGDMPAAVVQRLGAKGGTKGSGGEEDERGKKASRGGLDFRERIAAALERVNKRLDILDTFVLRGLVPADAKMSWQASRTSDAGLAEHVGASSAAAATEMAVTDGVTGINGVLDARKAFKESRQNPAGVASHAPRKKFPAKTLDAIQSLATYSSDVISAAKNSMAAEAVTAVAGVAEAGGGLIGTVAGVKSARAARRTVLTSRKYRDVKKIDVPTPVDDRELARLQEAEVASHWALGQAFVALEKSHDDDGDVAERLSAAMDQTAGALSAVAEAAGRLKDANDSNLLNTTRAYALDKQRNKMWKQGVGAVGDGARSAGGAVTIAAAATGALASNPVGWGLAAAAAGLLLSVTAYKAGRAGKKRYDGVRHPDRWAPPAEEGGPAPAQPAARPEALKEALKFWKKAAHGERDAMARTLYGLAAGPGVPVGRKTSPEMRTSARELLVALKAGPSNLRMTAEEWTESLNNPADAEKWQKEIANQLASS